MSSTRRTALIAGLFYLLTFVSMPTLALYSGVRATDYLTNAGASDSPALLGGFLEVIVGLAGIGTAVALYPVVRRQNRTLALGFVMTRTLEAAMIFAGVAIILTLVALHSTAADSDPASLLTTGRALILQFNGVFLLGQSLMPGLNALLLGTLLYRSGLVPRILPTIGLIGAPVHLTAVALTLFTVIDRLSPIAIFAALPIAVWEFSLGVYLVVKGFKPSAVTSLIARTSDASDASGISGSSAGPVREPVAIA